MKVAYCKYGDVVDELERLGPEPSLVPGGGPDHYIASFLSRVAGAQVRLVSYGGRGSRTTRGTASAVTLVGDSNVDGVVSSVFRGWLAFVRVGWEMLRFRPDGILCAMSGPGLWAAALTARWTGASLVCTRHASLELKSVSWVHKLRRTWNGAALKSADWVLCHGPYLEAELRAMGVDATRILQFNLSYKYVTEIPGDPASEMPSERQEKARVLFVGRLETEKGVFDLLQAIAPILKETDVELIYAGTGRALTRLKECATQLPGGQSRVKFLGHLGVDQLVRELRQATVVVTPTQSRYSESRCKAAIESLVSGTPVVAPAFGPFPYVVSHGINGLLYEPNSVASLNAALKRILSDPSLRGRLEAGALSAAHTLVTPDRTFDDALARTVFGRPGTGAGPAKTLRPQLGRQ